MNWQEVLVNPNWVPVEVVDGKIIFQLVDRVQDFSSRYLYGNPTSLRESEPVQVRIPVEEFVDVPTRTLPVHRIYHMSYGGSTILNQLLNIPGKCQTFNEPRYSHRLGIPILNYKTGQRIIPTEQHVLKTLPATISTHDDTCISGDKAVLIVPTLRNFIASVYSDDTQYRHEVVHKMLYHLGDHVGADSLIDACIKVWSNILDRFSDISTRFDTMTIHTDDLLFHPELVLPKVFEFFDVSVTADDVERQLQLMNTHSKTRKPIENRVEFLLKQRETYAKNCMCDVAMHEDRITAAENAAVYVNVLTIDP